MNTDLAHAYTADGIAQQWEDAAQIKWRHRLWSASIAASSLAALPLALMTKPVQADILNVLYVEPVLTFIVFLIGAVFFLAGAIIDFTTGERLSKRIDRRKERFIASKTATQALDKPTLFAVNAHVDETVQLQITSLLGRQRIVREEIMNREDEEQALEKIVAWKEEVETASEEIYHQALAALPADVKRTLGKQTGFGQLSIEAANVQTDAEAAAELQERLRSAI